MQASFPNSAQALGGWATAARECTDGDGSRDMLHKMVPVLAGVRGGEYMPLSSLVEEAWVAASPTNVLVALAWITLFDASEGQWLGDWRGLMHSLGPDATW